MSRFRVHKNQILFLLALAQFMVVLDVSIVNMALPSIRDSLHFQPGDLQWIVTVYTLGFGGFLLLGGRAADLFGRKRIFLGGLTAFTLISLLCGLAPSAGWLIAARAVQGLAAAFMSPAALSIVLNVFKEGKERNRALGVWGGVAAGGAAAGLLLGGVITEYLGWRWNFFVNFPVGLAVLIATLKIVPENKSTLSHRNLDLPGALFATTGLMTLVFGLTKAPQYGWDNVKTHLILAASAVLLALFILNEKRSRHPLVPLDIFRIRNLRAANMMQLPITSAMFSMFFFLTLYVQTILGFSPVKAGLAFLPITFVIGFTSANVSKLVHKIGFKPPMVVGPLFITAGLLFFSQAPVEGSYLTHVFPGLLITALGLGLTFVTITIAATTGVPHHRSGLASGILNTSQQIGGALGLAILSGIFATQVTESLKSGADFATAQVNGFDHAFTVGSFFTVIASLIALILVKNHKGHTEDEVLPAAH